MGRHRAALLQRLILSAAAPMRLAASCARIDAAGVVIVRKPIPARVGRRAWGSRKGIGLRHTFATADSCVATVRSNERAHVGTCWGRAHVTRSARAPRSDELIG